MNPFSTSTLTALALLTSPLAAQASILPYLPKDTLMAVTAPDLSTSMAEFAKMPLARMWAEEDVQLFVADLKEMIGKQLEQGMAQAKEMHAQGALPFDPELLRKLQVRGGSFAITKMAMAMGDFGPLPDFGFVLHLDFGDSAATWNSLLQMGLGMLEAQAGEAMEKQDSKIGEVAMTSLTPTQVPPGWGMGLHLAMVPNGLLLGTLADDVRGIVENMQKRTAVLGATALYQTTAKRVAPDGAVCEVYFRPQPLIDFAVAGLRMAAEQGGMDMVDLDGVDRALKAMGLDELGAMVSTSRYVDGKAVSRSFESSNKLSATAAVKPIDTQFLKWVPKEAVGFGSSSLDVMSIYDMLVRGLTAYDADFAKMAMGRLAEMEQQLGFNIRDDLFGSIGDHYITWSMPMGGITSAPEMAFLLKVTDDKKILNVLRNLAKVSNGMVELEEGEKRGVMAYQLRVNFDPSEGMGMNPFDVLQPTFAFKDGYLVGGFSASDVKRVFQRMDRADDPKGDIRSNKEFAAVASSIPTGISSLSFTDWKGNFESLYQIATGALAFVPIGEDVPIDMSMLPDSATLTKHLFASLSHTKTDASGTESLTTSPFGPEVGLLVAGAVIAGAALFGAMSSGF